MSGELSQFEQQSALVPKTMPYAILGGSALAVIIFVLIGMFASNEAVTDLKGKSDDSAQTSETPATAPSIDDSLDDF
jgi:hypothetical protein